MCGPWSNCAAFATIAPPDGVRGPTTAPLTSASLCIFVDKPFIDSFAIRV